MLVRSMLRKDQILTLPNLLSLVRLLLLPCFVCFYRHGAFCEAVIVLILSGLTDIADGFLARTWNMVSDFGKILDPVADKLTQVTMILFLAERYPRMWQVVAIFAVKLLTMGFLGAVVIKLCKVVNSAKWYGKMNTVILYVGMMVLILFPEMSWEAADCLIVICECSMIVTLILYVVFYLQLLCKGKKG